MEENIKPEETAAIDTNAAEKEILKNIASIGSEIAKEPIEEAEIIKEEEIKEDKIYSSDIKTETEAQTKKGRGRPKKPGNEKKEVNKKKSFVEEKQISTEEEKKEADALILLLNGSLIPLGSKIFNKNAAQCLITEKQMNDIIQLRPESNLLGKSWFAYFGAIVGSAAANFVRAETEDRIMSVIKTIKEMTPEQRIELRGLIIGE